MYSNVVPFKTKEFPKDKIWRVHAFGEVRMNPLICEELTVDLFIVPLKFVSDKGVDLNSSKSYDYSRLQSVRIGVGQIAGICVGSLLRDQRRMYRLPSYSMIKVCLNTQVDTPNLVRIGDNYHGEEGNPNPVRGVPDNYFLIPEELRQMPCLAYTVQREDKTRDGKIILNWVTILIPCWVVFQYYFGTSNKLINALISGDLENGSNQIFNPHPSLTYYNEEDDFFYLRLRQEMFDEDAQTIARIAADKRITLSAKNIYNSMVANYNDGRGAFPELHLPFFGHTEMELCGKHIKNGYEWIFFVYYIKSCSGEYPYNRLKYDRDNDGRENPTDNSKRKKAWNNVKKHISKARDKEDGQTITSDEPPCLNIIETEVVLPPRNFLSQPTDVRKLPKRVSNYRSAQVELLCRMNGTKKDLSTAAGESGGGTARLGIKTDADPKPRKPRESAPPNFDSMGKVLETLRRDNHPDFSYQLITVLEDEEYEKNGFSVFPAYRGRKRIAWSFIPGNPTRLRQILVAEIVLRDKYFYLLEIERRVSNSKKVKEYFNTFVLQENLSWIEKLHFEKVLLYLANNRGVYTREWEFSTITRKKFKHGWTIEDFPKSLIKYFNEEIAKEKPDIDSSEEIRVEDLANEREIERNNDSLRLAG